MLFNSISFLFFFPIVTALYFLLSQRFRNLFLLLASCFFYMYAIPKYILVLIYTITVDYFAGIQIEKTQGLTRKKWLVLSLFANIGILCVFKCFSVVQTIAHFFNLDDLPIFWTDLILPIGLSFHTFQAMSYTIEVYRGRQKAEKNPIVYALYVMFYPQLVAGPIERPQNLIHQFYETHSFDHERVVKGLRLMLWGLFKKVVVADLLGVAVDQVYNDVHSYSGSVLILATVFFSFQIVCDFSGYSDIAIGAAQVMGFNLMNNFNNPYISSSFSEFWKRWHISLSGWFRDYLYIPLGGNRVSIGRHYGNLLFTFLISGLWHGFSYTFAIWGLLNGTYIIFGILTKKVREKSAALLGLSKFPLVHGYLKVAFVFTLTCFAWIFFRAKNCPDAFYIVTHLYGSVQKLVDGHDKAFSLSDLGWNPYFGTVLIVSILFTQLIQNWLKGKAISEVLALKPGWFRWGFYYLLLISIIVVWTFSGPAPKEFLYYRF